MTWGDPLVESALAKTMSGLEYIQGLLDGGIPESPIMNLMNMRPVAMAVGRVNCTCDSNESRYNPIGTVHGGLVCTLLDSVLGCAVQSTLPQGQGYTSLEIKISYLRPVMVDTGQLTAVGIATRPGSRAAFADGTVHDSNGKLIATASSTPVVFPV